MADKINSTPPLPSKLDLRKTEILALYSSELSTIRWSRVPLIIIYLTLSVCLLLIVIIGMKVPIYSLISGEKLEGPVSEHLKYFIGGSTSLLGFIVLSMLKKLSEEISHFRSEYLKTKVKILKIKHCETEQELSLTFGKNEESESKGEKKNQIQELLESLGIKSTND